MSIVFKILKKTVVLLFSCLIAFVCGFLLWRIFSSGDPSSMKVISANDRLCEAYSQKGEELYMFRQEQRSITSGENNYGYFSITDHVIIPDANQIQTVFRYNTSTLEKTAEDFGLDSVPLRGDEVYDVTVLVAIDLTPDVKEDNSGNDPASVKFVRCHGKMTLSDTKNLYNYRRFVFQLDDADIDLRDLIEKELLLAIYADICYKGAIDYDKPYGTLCLYDFASENVRVKLDRKDEKALEEYSDD